ncbi:MAG: MFS transporter [Candidatus Nealsonbacteria bacterium]|nr:MFS transporter [Candidatus Nealsonbacteria bacterium]
MLSRNKHLKTLLALNAFFVFGATLLGPLYAVFVKDIGGNILTVGWSFAIYMIILGLAAYVTGKLGDKIKEKEYLLGLGYFLRGVGFFGYVFTQNSFHLLFVQIVLGVGEAFGNPSFKAIFSEHLDEGKYSSEWGVWDALYSVTVGLSAMIGAFIISSFGFETLFVIMGSIAFLSFIIILMLPRELL